MSSDIRKDSVCIIPARGGSKRIPKKNIRPFAGRPIIAYSIHAALRSGLFERIIVSTDSDEIARVALECGAEVPFMRPAELADDHATTSAVLLHALRWLRAHGDASSYACCIYPTAPFIQPVYLREGYELVRSGRAVAALSVTTYAYPIFRSLKLNQEGRTEYQWPEYRYTRSQDLPEAYHDAGQFYWYQIAAYLTENGEISGGAKPIILPRHMVQDIDTIEDWEMAELMFTAFRAKRTSSSHSP